MVGKGVLPPVPTPQGLKTKDFKAPPLDGSLTLVEVFEYNAKHSPNHAFFRYEDTPGHFKNINWKQLHRATYRVARIVESHKVPEPKIVAILALIDTVSYFTLIHGIIRAGHIPFPLSPRNSPAAIAHLLAKTKVTHMFVSGDPSMQGLSAGALKMAKATEGHSVELIPTPFYTELYESRPEEDRKPIPPAKKADLKAQGLMLHSSGTYTSYLYDREIH